MLITSLKYIFFTLISLGIIAIIWANIVIGKYAKFTYNSIDPLPNCYSAILLGTSKKISNGSENQYYKNRIEAAVKLYQANKCKKIVVSGDNRKDNYNEPLDMKRDLIKLGVSEQDIVCDFAGVRTLDSIIRFKEVFGQTSGIVVSQKFHNSRAIYIASYNGMNLFGFNAKDVDKYSGFKTRIREIISKFFCILDIKIFNTQPRHLGEKIQI